MQSLSIQKLLFLHWNPSFLQEESETEVTGVADDGPVGTKEASSTLVAALQSFCQPLMNDSYSNKEIVSELDFFLRPTEDDKSSLMSKITTLEFGCTVEDSQGPYLEDEGVTLRSSLLSTERET